MWPRKVGDSALSLSLSLFPVCDVAVPPYTTSSSLLRSLFGAAPFFSLSAHTTSREGISRRPGCSLSRSADSSGLSSTSSFLSRGNTLGSALQLGRVCLHFPVSACFSSYRASSRISVSLFLCPPSPFISLFLSRAVLPTRENVFSLPAALSRGFTHICHIFSRQALCSTAQIYTQKRSARMRERLFLSLTRARGYITAECAFAAESARVR